MSDNTDFVSDIDAILAEFSTYGGDEPAPAEKPQAASAPPQAPAQAHTEPERSPRQTRRADFEPDFDLPLERAPAGEKRSFTEETALRPEQETPARRRSESSGEAARVRRPAKAEFDPELFSWQDERRRPAAQTDARRAAAGKARREAAEAPSRRQPKEEPRRAAERPARAKAPAIADRPERAQRPRGVAQTALAAVSLLLSVLALLWVAVNVHPDSSTAVNSTTRIRTDLVGKLDAYVNNAASDAMGELAYIRKVYTISESATVAPKPDDAKYGVTTDPQVVLDLIDAASDLLEGQDVIFSPDVNFFPGSVIKYYYDDTILAIAWKELVDKRCCTFSEVKIANGSQLRRKLADDSYNPGIRYYATDLAKSCNAVLAINGDFYDFRNMGITVFQRQVYRVNPAAVDSCYFTASGDMLFSRKGELAGEGEAQAFVDANDIVFGVAFGPILVDNGELIYCGTYPIGEIDKTQSRAAICLVDTLHYMTANVNYEGDSNVTAKLNEFGEFIHSKGVQKAYALDGGQTSILVVQNEMFNRVDWGNERTMSDIIYFATAIPETEAAS